ncbi:MAG: Fmu (Sun) domain-containing protein [Chitinophagaceae bacterium]
MNTATEIISSYKGDTVFALFIKKKFSGNKKYGSKDRKFISHLCYCFFRLGKAASTLPVDEAILAGLFLCSDESNEILKALRPGWNERMGKSPEEKFLLLNSEEPASGLSIEDVFPWKDDLNEGIEYKNFCKSFFIQPDLFLRLRPGKEKIVKQKLQKAGTEFTIIKDDCLALSNSSGIDKIIVLNKEAVVQDYNSQRVGEFLLPLRQEQTVKVWDCCAASGGKSIMAKDILGHIDLTVSDLRESILINLKKRFKEAGITNYKSFVADLSRPLAHNSQSSFDLIICDAPCTGSGTWSRTPEQLYFFDRGQLDRYVSLQKQIAFNTIPYLQPGGYFLYITCSVFKKENEEVVEYINNNSSLNFIRMELIKGYDKKADTMFAALFQR